MTLLEFIKNTPTSEGHHVRRKIICNDGFTMSVQGSEYHYCNPRENNTLYSEMEIGYPSQVEDLLIEYASEEDNLTSSVYAYVPVELIQIVIDKHKGINEIETFK